MEQVSKLDVAKMALKLIHPSEAVVGQKAQHSSSFWKDTVRAIRKELDADTISDCSDNLCDLLSTAYILLQTPAEAEATERMQTKLDTFPRQAYQENLIEYKRLLEWVLGGEPADPVGIREIVEKLITAIDALDPMLQAELRRLWVYARIKAPATLFSEVLEGKLKDMQAVVADPDVAAGLTFTADKE